MIYDKGENVRNNKGEAMIEDFKDFKDMEW